MGERGRPALPASILQLKGERRARQAAAETAYVPTIAPPPPEDLTDAEILVWERLVPLLEQAGLVAEQDFQSLALLCEAWVRCRQAKAAIEATGLVWVEYGRARENPYLAILDRERRAVERYSRRFGLTPGDRRGLGQVTKKGPDKLEAWQEARKRG